VSTTPIALDEQLPAWGDSPYVDLRLSGTMPVSQALTQLYVLMPVLDDSKHYWVSPDEVDKLMRAGGSWLAGHPERATITSRYLGHHRSLVQSAVGRLAEVDDTEPDVLGGGPAQEQEDRPAPLAQLRTAAVVAALREEGASSVVDLGCGQGALLRELVPDPAFTKVLGVDVSHRALEVAARRLHLDRMPDSQRARLELVQSSATYRDDRLAGYDAVVLMEVIEHLDPPRLPALVRSVFHHARPTSVLVTTPNAEHNVRYPALPAGAMRHRDHRFEWTRRQFQDWAQATAASHGYTVRYLPVGDDDPEVGAPTQLASSGGPRDRARHPRAVAGLPRRCERLGQVHVRPPALRGLRGRVERLLPGPGRRRRERPVCDRRGVRGLALHRRQAARRRPADRHRRHQRAARVPAFAGRARPRARRAARRRRAGPA